MLFLIIFSTEMVSMMNPMVYVRNQPEAPASEQPKQSNMMGFPFQQGKIFDQPGDMSHR